MRFLKGVARILAALALVVVEWVEALGKFIVKAMPGYQPPAPDDVVEAYAEAVEAASVAPAADQRLQNIQALADALFRGQPVKPEWSVGLSEKTLMWIGAQNADMLLLTARAKPDELRAHMAGKKPIRGLLAADPESVAAYLKAVEAPAAPAPKPKHTRRSRRRTEPLMPAIGAMC